MDVGQSRCQSSATVPAPDPVVRVPSSPESLSTTKLIHAVMRQKLSLSLCCSSLPASRYWLVQNTSILQPSICSYGLLASSYLSSASPQALLLTKGRTIADQQERCGGSRRNGATNMLMRSTYPHPPRPCSGQTQAYIDDHGCLGGYGLLGGPAVRGIVSDVDSV